MIIRLAHSAGFCFGVKRAIETALQTARSRKQVVMQGDIVHNEEVIRQIRRQGIKKISDLKNGKGKVFLVRAHGMSAKKLHQIKTAGFEIVDATCPMVKEIHRIAQGLERDKRTIIIIGDPRHDEVLGIAGQLKNKAHILNPDKPIPWARFKKIKRAGVIVQSTQNIDTVHTVISALRSRINDLVFKNTICGPTRTKQKEIKILPLKNDCMIIIGSKTSANTKRLFEIARLLNPNSHLIQNVSDLKKSWFKNASSVGVTAGASTPKEITLKVLRRLKKIR